MVSCELCGKETKNDAGLKAHKRFKHPVVEQPEPIVVNMTTASSGTTTTGEDKTLTFSATDFIDEGPAIIPEWNNEVGRIKVTVVGREIKMLRPICATCQRGKQTTPGWWLRCTHNPYVSVIPITTQETQYEDLGDGRKKVTGIEEYVHYEERPNRTQVSAWRRINSGVLVEKKRRRSGFILPEELRSPTFPNGIKNPCEFRDCYVQENLITTRWGNFCRRIEAQLVGHDARMDGGGGALEVGDSQQSLEKQRMQLEAVPL